MLTKEQLRQQRKEAYRKARAKRDADPKYIAFKFISRIKPLFQKATIYQNPEFRAQTA